MKYFFVCYIKCSSALLALYYKMPQKDNICQPSSTLSPICRYLMDSFYK